MITPMDHQKKMAFHWAEVRTQFDQSDPGTGKTIGTLLGFAVSRLKDQPSRLLVLAPLSILKSSWADDIEKLGSDLTWSIAHGTPKKRKEAFNSGADVVITNHDGVKWLEKNPDLLAEFTHICVDESTAFKNAKSQRSAALVNVAKQIPFRRLMTGTPNPNSVTDLWHQVFLLDWGERLGKFFQFRNACCDPTQVGAGKEMVQWTDKPGAVEYVSDKIKDITMRFKREDCLDLPERTFSTMLLDVPDWLRKQYDEFEKHSVLETNTGLVKGVHASAKVRKMLQLLSGAVYDQEGNAVRVHDERYELVMQLISEREQVLVGFNWKHEVAALVDAAKKWKFSYAVINGDTPASKRAEIVEQFQRGEIRVIFAHPQSAGHGLTMTAATTLIWCSPTYNSEHYEQFNARNYRKGQEKKVEVIRIAYRGTKEIDVYAKLDDKVFHMNDLLSMMKNLTAPTQEAA
jgi:SNF2 family DNA or RNA helicase